MLEATLTDQYNMKINKVKTKILVLSKHRAKDNMALNRHLLENVEEFAYAGSKITPNGRKRREVTSHLSFNKKKDYSPQEISI